MKRKDPKVTPRRLDERSIRHVKRSWDKLGRLRKGAELRRVEAGK